MTALAALQDHRRSVPLRSLGLRRLTRAHLVLEQRPLIGRSCLQALARVAQAWSEALAVPVHAEGRLLDASFSVRQMLSPHCVYASFELSAIGARATLEVELPFAVEVLELLAGQTEAGHSAAELTRAETAGFGYLLLVGLAAFRQESLCQQLWSPRLMGVHRTRGEALELLASETHVCIELVLQIGPHRSTTRLFLPAGALQTATVNVPGQEPDPRGASTLFAQLELRACLGQTALDEASAHTLSLGDVVVLERFSCQDGRISGPLRLRGPLFELRGESGLSGFTFLEARQSLAGQERAMDTSENTIVDSLEQLPVQVEVELARVTLPVARLAHLKPGSVLPLHISVADPVWLKLGDRAIARAELVDIDGEVGARILALLSDE